jgi:hypothetical protein
MNFTQEELIDGTYLLTTRSSTNGLIKFQSDGICILPYDHIKSYKLLPNTYKSGAHTGNPTMLKIESFDHPFWLTGRDKDGRAMFAQCWKYETDFLIEGFSAK